MDQREEGEETNRKAKRVAHMEEVLHPSIYRRRGAAAQGVRRPLEGAPTSSLIMWVDTPLTNSKVPIIDIKLHLEMKGFFSHKRIKHF